MYLRIENHPHKRIQMRIFSWTYRLFANFSFRCKKLRIERGIQVKRNRFANFYHTALKDNKWIDIVAWDQEN